MKPFFKWSGGKRREIKRILEYMPPSYDKYYEPFVGGGALWLHLEPEKAIINDSYPDVMNFYDVLRTDTARFVETINQLSSNFEKEVSNIKTDEELEKKVEEGKKEIDIHSKVLKEITKPISSHLNEMSKKEYATKEESTQNKRLLKHLRSSIKELEAELKTKKELHAPLLEELKKDFNIIADKYYYHYRNNAFDTQFDQAVRFYILRQLSFSGMLRFDSKGSYNIPFGWYKSLKKIEESEANIKRVLGNTTFLCDDWYESVKDATKNDFVFLDPPYTRKFTKYHPNGEFLDEEHRRLSKWFHETEAQVMIIINKDEFTTKLYDTFSKDTYGHKYSIQYRNRMKEEDSNAVHMIATNY